MVNLWSPDPPQNHCDAEVGPISSSSLAIVGGSSSDSENDEIASNGYELLPMTPLEDLELNSDLEVEVSNAELQAISQASEIEGYNSQDPNLNQDEMVHPTSCDSEGNIQERQEMDPELMEQVRVAMSGFSLPLAAVPSWAFHVPEEEWRSHLVERMQCIQRGVKPSQSNPSNMTDDSLLSQSGK